MTLKPLEVITVVALEQAVAAPLSTSRLADAGVFVQNLAPDAVDWPGFGSEALRERHPRLVTCDISGYGEECPRQQQKAYDLLVQAETGLVAVSGAPGPWECIGVSICDIAAEPRAGLRRAACRP